MRTTITAELDTDTVPTSMDLVDLARLLLNGANGTVTEVKVWRGPANENPNAVVTRTGGDQ